MGKILELTADGRRRTQTDADRRRQTQTFSSADLAEENRLALRAGERSAPGEVPGDCEWFLIAKRSHLLAPQVAELKIHAAECENIQLTSACVCAKKR